MLVQRGSGLIITTVGLIVFTGWLLGLPLLRSIRESWATMKADTALGFVLVGVSLWARRSRRVWSVFSRACAAGAVALALLAIGEYLVGRETQIGTLLRQIGPAGAPPPTGRMALTTAVAFALSGSALWLLGPRPRTSPLVPQLFALTVAFIAFVGLLGYAFDVYDLYGQQSTSMAVHTALLFVAAATGILAARPDVGLVPFITGKSPGGIMLRRVGLIAVTVSFVLGWLRELGQRAGLYSTEAGMLWMIAAFGLLGFLAITQTARRMNRDARRICESEARYRTLADAVPQLTWVLEPEGAVSFFNQRWYEYTGLPPSRIVEQGWIGCIHPEDRERVERVHARALDAGEPWEIEARLRRCDGAYRWFLMRVVPLRDTPGAIAAWYGAALDIDERRRAEDALRGAVQLREQVLAVVSHDLNNPIHAIQLSSALLGAQLQANGDALVKVESIRRSAARMEQLTRDLLDAAKLEAGTLALELRPEAGDQMVREVAELMRPQAEAKKIELRVSAEAGGAVMMCDRHRILQVLSNVLGNAIKFTPPAGRVTVGLRRGEDGALFSVADTGPGIPAADLPRLFDRFWQARETASRGTGLGLSIAKGLVDAHDGRIWAESEPGRGSTFFVWLPVAPARAPVSRPIPSS